MKKKICLSIIILFIVGTSTLNIQAEAKKIPIIIMGVYTPINIQPGFIFIFCPPPYDRVCFTCDGHGDGPGTNLGRFYHNPDNQEIGLGYTDVNIEYVSTPEGTEYRNTFNPGNQIITDYQTWLNYFNLERPF
ncbi:MAG: hypothetical protein EPN82_14005 [Bacteroidetes bacterium]|nr:MAG: hypothetical protein EPN82_14005 [Bacteroidota bacterium]